MKQQKETQTSMNTEETTLNAYKDGQCVFCGGHDCNEKNPCKWRKQIIGDDTYPEELVDKAVHHVQDLLNRTLIPFVLLGELVERIVHNKSIAGIKEIEVGVFQKDLVRERISSLKTEIGDITTDYGFGYKFDRIPIQIKIISKDYKFFENPDIIFYKSGEYRIPNPIEDYLKVRQEI